MVNHTTIRPPGDGPVWAVVGDWYTFKAVGANTGGAYAMFEFLIQPGNGSPPHVHHREDEAFCILEGELTFHVDGHRHMPAAGGFIHAPRDIAHYFQNESTSAAHVLCVVTPAGIERFFEEAGFPVIEGSPPLRSPTPEDIERVPAAAPRYGIDILPLPAGARAIP